MSEPTHDLEAQFAKAMDLGEDVTQCPGCKLIFGEDIVRYCFVRCCEYPWHSACKKCSFECNFCEEYFCYSDQENAKHIGYCTECDKFICSDCFKGTRANDFEFHGALKNHYGDLKHMREWAEEKPELLKRSIYYSEIKSQAEQQTQQK